MVSEFLFNLAFSGVIALACVVGLAMAAFLGVMTVTLIQLLRGRFPLQRRVVMTYHYSKEARQRSKYTRPPPSEATSGEG